VNEEVYVADVTRSLVMCVSVLTESLQAAFSRLTLPLDNLAHAASRYVMLISRHSEDC